MRVEGDDMLLHLTKSAKTGLTVWTRVRPLLGVCPHVFREVNPPHKPRRAYDTCMPSQRDVEGGGRALRRHPLM